MPVKATPSSQRWCWLPWKPVDAWDYPCQTLLGSHVFKKCQIWRWSYVPYRSWRKIKYDSIFSTNSLVQDEVYLVYVTRSQWLSKHIGLEKHLLLPPREYPWWGRKSPAASDIASSCSLASGGIEGWAVRSGSRMLALCVGCLGPGEFHSNEGRVTLLKNCWVLTAEFLVHHRASS